MAGGIRFAYVAAPNAGVPYVEIAYLSPEIKAFYDYIKQEQQVSRGNDDAHRSDEQEARR